MARDPIITVDLRIEKDAKSLSSLSRKCRCVCKGCDKECERSVRFLLNVRQSFDSCVASEKVKDLPLPAVCHYCMKREVVVVSCLDRKKNKQVYKNPGGCRRLVVGSKKSIVE